MTDDEAVRRCQEGDRDAFRYIVERYKNPLFGTAVVMSHNRTVAEEHVQDAFLSAWRGIRTFERGRPLKPWLMRILVNTVLASRRRRALTTVPIENDEGDTLPLEAPNDDLELVETSDEREAVRAALAQLSPEHRQVLVLRYFADLTVPQVAESAGVREGTVKSRLHRGLRQLRALLEQQDVLEVSPNGA